MLTCRKIKRIKRVESFLSFHISAELLGPVSANIKVYSGSLKGYQCLFDTYRAAIKFVDLKIVYIHGMEVWSYRCNGNETLLFTDVFLSLKLQTLRSGEISIGRSEDIGKLILNCCCYLIFKLM